MDQKDHVPYKIITKDVEGYYEDKKSRFLSYLHPVKSEEEAAEFIAAVRKKHYDARHNCYAMIIGSGSEFKKSSDDGEPSKTAGLPMLEELSFAALTNIVAVVTRYFGGTLLGTGGLVRAYRGAVKDALSKATIKTVEYCADIDVTVPYSDQGQLAYYFESENVFVMSTDYAENISYHIRVRDNDSENIIKKLTDITQGRAGTEVAFRGYNAI